MNIGVGPITKFVGEAKGVTQSVSLISHNVGQSMI